MTRNLLLLVHVAAVAAWLGANLVQFVISPRMRRAGPEAARAWSETGRFLGQRYYNAVGAAVAVSGVALVLHGHWEWRGFVLVGIGTVIVGALLGILAFDRLYQSETAALASGDAAGAAIARTQHHVGRGLGHDADPDHDARDDRPLARVSERR